MFAIYYKFSYDGAMFSEVIEQKVKKLISLYAEQGLKVVTVESCTGGLLGASITHISGSSAIYERGFITYSNTEKENLVNIPHKTLETYGAVSDETVLAMSLGAYTKENEIAISISGIAGPSGATKSKPVGLVHFGLKSAKTHIALSEVFDGNREDIRLKAVNFSLDLLLKEVQKNA